MKDLVGFRVSTFYHAGHNDSDIIFWEKLDNGMIGRTKTFRTASFTKKCLDSINILQDELQDEL